MCVRARLHVHNNIIIIHLHDIHVYEYDRQDNANDGADGGTERKLEGVKERERGWRTQLIVCSPQFSPIC